MTDVEATDSRYKHLLAPIRDMATNWNIDIATELEEYLDELASINFSLDDGSTNLNFAEAALMIQGFTCVYSRKVEYLYNLLYSALEHILQKKKTEKSKSSINELGVDMDAVFNDSAELLPLDDMLADGKNIDLDESKQKDYDTMRKNTLLRRPPFALLSQESQGDQQIFKVSDCMVHESGALLFSEKDKAYMSGSRVTHEQELPFGSPKALMMSPSAVSSKSTLSKALSPLIEKQAELNMDAVSDDDDDDDGFDVGADDGWGDETNENKVEQKPAPTNMVDEHAQFIEEDNQQQGPEEDLWAMEDPHDCSAAKPKPFKKGKTFRIPQPSNTSLPVHNIKDFVDVVYTDPIHKALQHSISKSSCKVPYFSEFGGLFVTQIKKTTSSCKRNPQRTERIRSRTQTELTCESYRRYC